jgi:hypothetical protein
MSSLRDSFNELLARMRHGRDLGQTSYKPIYYLVFPPRQILEVKRELPAWMARLRNENWVLHRFSMAQAVADVLQQAPPAEQAANQGLAHQGRPAVSRRRGPARPGLRDLASAV